MALGFLFWVSLGLGSGMPSHSTHSFYMFFLSLCYSKDVLSGAEIWKDSLPMIQYLVAPMDQRHSLRYPSLLGNLFFELRLLKCNQTMCTGLSKNKRKGKMLQQEGPQSSNMCMVCRKVHCQPLFWQWGLSSHGADTTAIRTTLS